MRYFLVLAFCILGWSFSANAGKLTPFVSDGCSSSPDGFVEGAELLECCLIHDVQYWKGGTLEEKQQADAEFKMCLDKRTFPWMAQIYYQSVKVGGDADLGAPWAWGYGWKPLREYSPLTAEEKQSVQQMSPNLSVAVPLTRTYEMEEPRIAIVKMYLKLRHNLTPTDVSSVYRFAEMKDGKIQSVEDVPKDKKYLLLMSNNCPQGYYLADATDFFKTGTLPIKRFGTCPELPVYSTEFSISLFF